MIKLCAITARNLNRCADNSRVLPPPGLSTFGGGDAIPAGVNYPNVRKLSKDDATQELSDILNRVELGIIRLQPIDPLHERLAADCFDQYKEFARARWSLLMAPQNPLPTPFLRMLVAWLTMIFVCFGVRASANPLVMIMVALSAATLSSMMFAIMNVVDPYQGLYNISSKNMHQALDAMLRHNSSVNVSTGSPAASDESATRPHKPDETDSAHSVLG